MNIRLLIEAVVRQTMVLVAELATSGGLRAPLSHVAGQAFLELARELENQGVGKKVSADMFGMALRTYQRRTQRLSQSLTDRGRSLWEATLEFIEQSGVVRRDDILRRFRHDDEPSLRGVLRDLTDSGLVFSSGVGSNQAFRVATNDEAKALKRGSDNAGLEAFVWSVIYRTGSLSTDELSERTSLSLTELQSIVEGLIAAGKVVRQAAAPHLLEAKNLVLGFDDPTGWDQWATLRVREWNYQVTNDLTEWLFRADGGVVVSTYSVHGSTTLPLPASQDTKQPTRTDDAWINGLADGAALRVELSDATPCAPVEDYDLDVVLQLDTGTLEKRVSGCATQERLPFVGPIGLMLLLEKFRN